MPDAVCLAMSVTDLLASHPEAAILAAIIARAILAYQRQLTWTEYRSLHGIKRLTFPTLDRLEPAGYDHFIHPKGGRADAEYLATVDTDIRATVRQLTNAGGSLHLLNALKRRPDTHGDPLSAAHVVWTHDDGTQLEAFLFRNADDTTDVYAHRETSVTDPDGHLTDGQTDGDPQGIVRDALNQNA